MLLAARNLVPARSTSCDALDGDDGLWTSASRTARSSSPASSCRGHTLGVIGLGKIGSLVADTAIRLGMNVLGYDPHITVDAAWSLPVAGARRTRRSRRCSRAADFVTLHVPLVDKTRHLINAERIELVRNGAVLLNFSRDGIVDEDAVLKALAAASGCATT